MQLRDLLSRMAEPNPRRRITAAEVLEHPHFVLFSRGSLWSMRGYTVHVNTFGDGWHSSGNIEIPKRLHPKHYGSPSLAMWRVRPLREVSLVRTNRCATVGRAYSEGRFDLSCESGSAAARVHSCVCQLWCWGWKYSKEFCLLEVDKILPHTRSTRAARDRSDPSTVCGGVLHCKYKLGPALVFALVNCPIDVQSQHMWCVHAF